MEGHDHLSFMTDKTFSKLLLAGENVFLSCKVIKFNRFNRAQERNLVVTNKGLLNLKSKKMKRRMELSEIAGVTQSENGDEFVVHVPNEYDYRYSSPLKEQIVRFLSVAFRETLGGNLVIWERAELYLKEFATTKADKKKGISKIPPVNEGINYHEEQKGGENRRRTIYAAPENSNTVTAADFKILKVLGRGAFGKVMLVQKLDSQNVYAMKSLRKDALLEREEIEHTKTEKLIMEHVNHPYLVKLEYAFSSVDKIYFVMAYMRGGELFFHLREARKFSEDRARFYGAQVALGLAHLHSENIVYRDLKPENILLDDLGNAHLTDFGMAKMLGDSGSTESFCGTPEYLPPEIILSTGHNTNADWWSFGILMYEMLVGIPPFYNQNTELMYELIEHGELRFPERTPLSDNAIDLIEKLLDREPSTRLGSRGFEEIENHPFFGGVDWDEMMAKAVEPPFKPSVEGLTSTENFSEEFTSEEAVNSVVPEHKMRMIRQHQEEFKDFN